MFEGVGVALVTPFASDRSIDYNALGAIIDDVINGGVDFLVALGTTAETPTLSPEEKSAVVAFIIEKNGGRCPVVLGHGGNNTRQLTDSLATLPLNRIDGLLSVAPYYNKPSQEGIYQHFKTLANATDKPVILYNVPGRTSSDIHPDTAVRLANDCKNIVGIKDASGNITQAMELVQKVPEGFSVLSGDDPLLLAQAAIGMKGVISVAANCYPKEFCRMAAHALKGEMEQAKTIHYKLFPLLQLLFKEGNPAGVKYALHLKGRCENILRLPLVPASEDLQVAFQSYQ